MKKQRDKRKKLQKDQSTIEQKVKKTKAQQEKGKIREKDKRTTYFYCYTYLKHHPPALLELVGLQKIVDPYFVAFRKQMIISQSKLG